MTHLTAQYFGIANVTTESFDVVDQQTYLSMVNHHFGLNTQIAASVQCDMRSLAFHAPAARAHFVTFIEEGTATAVPATDLAAADDGAQPESGEENVEVDQESDTDDR
jgi:hypothetical protein